MKRLLQGDVGSGKTKVALGAMLMAVESGHQAALMAPIGVLVQQHYEEIAETCEQLGIRTVLVPGASKVKARREALAGLASGEIHIAIGTTGLLSDDVVFKSLGLAVIDEQHRFGVEQRAALLAKAPGDAVADELGATATPIPRTAAMTVFGDTDISILDELPPGRTPIDTQWLQEVSLDNRAHSHWRFVRAQIDSGRQAFVVCPLVAEPETKTGQESEAQAAAAIETSAALTAGALSGLRIGVVTGRQKPAERAEIMATFVAGGLDVLVATTVIEVGVSVPNATSITILDAARFGLAQLHQLRGRVGRGTHPGYCVLTGGASDVGQTRLNAMCATTDGFALANIDLELRGPGALAGTAQAGHRAGLLVADLLADADFMYAARADAADLLTTDPNLARRPTLRAEVERALGADAHFLQRS
jgi:ATP-dependent DNA helicase RecG